MIAKINTLVKVFMASTHTHRQKAKAVLILILAKTLRLEHADSVNFKFRPVQSKWQG